MAWVSTRLPSFFAGSPTPSSRDFDLADLVVITAHTGDEFEQTLRDVEEVVLPALRRHRVRFIQVGRSQRKTTASGQGAIRIRVMVAGGDDR